MARASLTSADSGIQRLKKCGKTMHTANNVLTCGNIGYFHLGFLIGSVYRRMSVHVDA